jgi:glycosyltransferase involved in cell wall biosynthesis
MKQYCVISAPPDTYSGYGARARDFIKAIYELKKDEWEIQILPQRWGNTSWGFLEDYKEEWGWMIPLLLKGPMTKQPDVWFQITVPNEFQAVGKVSIGVTAGIETTVCDPSWIDGCNRMNLTLVSSVHAKNVLQFTSYQKKDQPGVDIRITKPIEVLFEGVDLNKYFHIKDEDLPATELVEDLDSIKEDFCFLYVGHWLQGELGEDRKNTGMLVKTFLETFKGKKAKPALIMKTSSATSCIMDRNEMLKKIDAIRKMVPGDDLPNIYLLHGDLDDVEMNHLYNHPKVKAFASFTKGEGYGRPLAEFCTSKKPVIASGWSGHIDFLNSEFSILLPGKMTETHPSAHSQGLILPNSNWFTVDYGAAAKALEDVYSNYKKYEEMGKRQGHKIKTEFSYDNMVLFLSAYLGKYVPKQVELKLPQLKKIELPKLK